MFNVNKILIGWQEWCALPDLHVKYIKAKVDTGAKTSSLHAFNIREFYKNKKKYVAFDIHPVQFNDNIIISTKALVVDERYVMSSNGHNEKRYVIATMLKLGDCKYEIELTLSNRDPLRFRMLLGRDALRPHCIIDPAKISCLKKYSKNFITKYYKDSSE